MTESISEEASGTIICIQLETNAQERANLLYQKGIPDSLTHQQKELPFVH